MYVRYTINSCQTTMDITNLTQADAIGSALPASPHKEDVVFAPSTHLTYQDLEKFWQDKMETKIKKMIESIVNERIDTELKKTQRRQITTANTRRPALLNFGQENYEHLLLPYMANTLKGTGDFTVILQRVVRDLYFNPEQKRNHNVYIPRDAYNSATVYKDNDWRSYPLDYCLEGLVRRANDVLQHYIIGVDEEVEKGFEKEIGKKKMDSLKDFTNKLDSLEQFPELRQKVYADTEHTIITHQHIAHPKIYEIPENT